MTASSNNHKRKGDSIFQESTNRVVVVDGNKYQQDAASRMDALKMKMKNLRDSFAEPIDPILEAFQMVNVNPNEPFDQLMEQSKTMHADLDAQIEEARTACQQESSVLMQLTVQTKQLEQNRDKILQDMDEIDQRQVGLQRQIALHQLEASQEIECIDSVEEQRKREVPRLKTHISLYASTTGIKWDFTKDEVLSGSVAIPDQHGLKLFSIDHRDYSSVDTANRLWSLMEGGAA